MLAYIFPGQGAQSVGMGKELLEDFRTLERKASEILGYSLKSLCLEDKEKQLNQTRYTQPALYTVNALTYIKEFEEKGIDPDYLAGHSLGEYSALFAAGVFDFETGLKLVKKRGELMSEVKNGAMAAVISDDLQAVIDVVNQCAPNVDIANYNSDKQLVLSGPKSDLDSLDERHLRDLPCRFVPLAVSASFHSRYMAEAAEEFRRYLDSVEVKPPRVKVLSNVSAEPYPDAPDEIKALLAKQINSSVNWLDSVRFMRKQNVVEFQEMGPGQVLSGLMHNIQ